MFKFFITTLIPLVVCETFTLGPSDGHFFDVGLAEETNTFRLSYYTNMNFGTRVLNA